MFKDNECSPLCSVKDKQPLRKNSAIISKGNEAGMERKKALIKSGSTVSFWNRQRNRAETSQVKEAKGQRRNSRDLLGPKKTLDMWLGKHKSRASPKRQPERAITQCKTAKSSKSMKDKGPDLECHISNSFDSMPSLESSHCSIMEECLENLEPSANILLVNRDLQEEHLNSHSHTPNNCNKDLKELTSQIGAIGEDFELDSRAIHNAYQSYSLKDMNRSKSLATELQDAGSQDIFFQTPVTMQPSLEDDPDQPEVVEDSFPPHQDNVMA